MKSKRKIKTYKTVEEVVEAKSEGARKFLQSVDIPQIIALHPTPSKTPKP
ncbi:hypothetical protein [Emticicia fluvialis]|nr:hypothetical protein [Emticicia fluvialis]